MIIKRVFIEVIQDRLSGGPASADMPDKYPEQMIERMVDMAMPMVIESSPKSMRMAVKKSFTASSDSGGYYITLDPSPCAHVAAINTASDNNGQFYVIDENTHNAFKVLRTQNSNKNAAILFGNQLRLNRTPSGQVNMTYVPLISEMADDDQIIIPTSEDGMSELAFYDAITKAILSTDKFWNEKTNNNLIDPR